MGFLRSLNPQLPRSVQTLQVGGLANAFGNGIVLPFTFIYLHNVRGIGLGMFGLILATNAAVSLVAGPVTGRSSTASAGSASLPHPCFSSRQATVATRSSTTRGKASSPPR